MHILLADDHEFARQSLKAILISLNEEVVIHDASSYEQALKIATEVMPGRIELAVIDFRMPGIFELKETNFRLLRDIIANCGKTVIWSGDINHAEIEDILNIGISGFIPKTHSINEIKAALNLIMAGGSYVPYPLSETADSSACQKLYFRAPGTVELTDREKEIWQLLCDGASNKEIARRLDIAPSTVKTYLQRLFRKLNVKRRTQAVKLAFELKPFR